MNASSAHSGECIVDSISMDHIFLKVAGDYNFNAVAFKLETCT